MSETKPVIIFTDGACSGNPGPGGWGSILVSPLGKVWELGGGEAQTTNNRMEMTAVVEALRALAAVKTLSTKEIRIFTDSKYVINGITQWIHGWRRNGWKNAAGEDVSNKEIWEALDRVIQSAQFKVDWNYVPGHMGYAGNERCDEIAVAFAKGYSIDLYNGPRTEYRVDIDHLPPPAALSSAPKEKKGPVVYLSMIGGEVFRDKDWKSCEARVKGRNGAKFKKVQSSEEEEQTLKSWGKR